jgi:hypothetical protein
LHETTRFSLGEFVADRNPREQSASLADPTFGSQPNRDDVAADCVAQTAFEVVTGGRAAGVEQNGSFFRTGSAGGWMSTLTLR